MIPGWSGLFVRELRQKAVGQGRSRPKAEGKNKDLVRLWIPVSTGMTEKTRWGKRNFGLPISNWGKR
jgi:hypothetical protein